MITNSKIEIKDCLRGILIATVLLGSTFFNEAVGRKIRTNHKIEKRSSANQRAGKADEAISRITMENDSAVFDPKSLSFSGYDKTINSSKESFLITNHNSEAIEAVDVKITYLDMKGRMLHAREVRVSCYVPAGETRKADITSWDTQRTYYYYLGQSPKKIATPYKVKIIPLRVAFESTSTKE